MIAAILSCFNLAGIKHDIEINRSALQIIKLAQNYEIDRMICDPTRSYRFNVNVNENVNLPNIIHGLQILLDLNSHRAERISNLLQTLMLLEPAIYYQELQVIPPSGNSLLQFRRGLLSFIQGDIVGAVQIWTDIDVGHRALGVGDLCRHLDRDDLAETWYEIAVQTVPEQGKAYFSLGLLYYETGEYEKAITELLQALESGYRERVAYEYAGAALAKAGRIEDSVNILRHGLELYPKSVRLLYWHASSNYLLGRFSESIASYKLILEFESKDMYALLGLARVYLHIGDLTTGLKNLNTLLDVMETRSAPMDICNELQSMSTSLTDSDLVTRINQHCGERSTR